jgi:predicted secreted protein
MTWTLGLAVYFVIWWTILFAVLPFYVRSQQEEGNVVPGSDPGAPAKPQLLRRALVNTVVAGVIWVFLNWAYIYFYLEENPFK